MSPSQFVNPFVIGYHTETDTDTKQVLQQDGFISAIQAFMFMVSLGFAISIAHWITLETQTVYVNRVAVEVVLSMYMIMGIFIIIYLWKAKCVIELHIKKEPVVPKNVFMVRASQAFTTRAMVSWFRYKIRKVLPVIGIVLFYTLGAFIDLLRSMAHMTCMPDFYECGTWVLARYSFSIAFHIIRLVFMGLLMLFCAIFYNRVFVQCTCVRYGLLVILAASLTVWFDSTLYDSEGIIREENDTIHNKCQNGFNSTACIKEQTEMYRTIHNLSPYLYPLNIEFLLLAMKTTLLLFFHCTPKEAIKGQLIEMLVDIPSVQCTQCKHSRNKSRNNSPARNGLGTKQSDFDSTITVNASTILSVADVHVEFGRNSPEQQQEVYKQPLLTEKTPNPANNSTTVAQINCTSQSEGKNSEITQNPDDECASLGHPESISEECTSLYNLNSEHSIMSRGVPQISSASLTCFYVALLVNLMLITMGFLTYQKEYDQMWLQLYHITKIIYWIPAIVVCVIGFRLTKTFEPKFHDFHALELTVIFSLLGYSVYSFFTLASSFACIGGTHRKENMLSLETYGFTKCTIWLMTIDVLLNTIQTFLQTIFMSHSSRVTAEVPEDIEGYLRQIHTGDTGYLDNNTTNVPQLSNTSGTSIDDEDTESDTAPLIIKTGQNVYEPSIQITSSPENKPTSLDHHDHVAETISSVRRRRRIFLNILLYLLIGNFTWWISDSFVEMKNHNLEPVQTYYYGNNWTLISKVTMPLSLFYRFNIFIVFTEIFLDN